VEERIKLIPPKTPDPLSAVQVNAEQFQWLLEEALSHQGALGGEDPRLVAMYWGHRSGIPPRAMAKVLGDLTPVQVKHRIIRFQERVEKDPELAKRLDLP